MLTPEFHATAANPISTLILTAENRIIQDIARRISAMTELSATSEYQLMRLADIQEFDHNYKKELAGILEQSEQKIDVLYAEAATKAHEFDKRLYDAKDIPFVPYEENQYLQQLATGIANQTKNEFKNLSRSMGFTSPYGALLPPRQFYIATLDNAVFQVTTGLRDYNSVIKDAVGNMARQGLSVVDYASGRRERIESVVRRNVLSGTKQISREISKNNGQRLGLTIGEFSYHMGHRPSHSWGGMRYDITGLLYLTREQLFMENGGGTAEDANCRHDEFFTMAEMPPAYTDEQLKEMRAKDAETKPYEFTHRTSRRDPDNPDNWLFRKGDKYIKELTYYDQTQVQRGMERQMMAQRRVISANKAARLDDAYKLSKARYYMQRTEYKAFSNVMEIDTDFSRIYADGLGRV